MSADNHATANTGTLSPSIIASGALLLGIALVAAEIAPTRLLAHLVAAYPVLRTGVLLFCCSIVLTGWSAFVVWRPARMRGQPPGETCLTLAAENVPASDEPNCLVGSVARATFATALDAAAIGPGAAALLVVDIDGFRGLARTHGSADAEKLRHQFGRRLIDLAPAGAILACLPAGEFAVLLPLADDAASGLAAAALLACLSRPFALEGHAIDIAASIGVALAPGHATDADGLLRAARLAVVLAKSDGGRAWRLFDAGLCQAVHIRNVLRAELRPALEDGQFVPFYQPIVSLANGNIVGMEVLARWRHPRRGLLTPDSFIHLMEDQRLCGQLSLSLLRQAIEDARAWPLEWTFAFNASAGQLRELLPFIGAALQIQGSTLTASRIEFELTETALIEDMALAREMVLSMHSHGAKVVLDDFGTGYANFLHLRELPFDRIKIDRSFVHDMLLNERTDACIRAMLDLGHSLGASVIAEGVETAAAERRLRDLGCEFAQGFYYSQPVAAEGVALLARRAESRAWDRAVAA